MRERERERESLTRKLVRERVSQGSWCERESHKEVGVRESLTIKEVGVREILTRKLVRERFSQGSW